MPYLFVGEVFLHVAHVVVESVTAELAVNLHLLVIEVHFPLKGRDYI